MVNCLLVDGNFVAIVGSACRECMNDAAERGDHGSGDRCMEASCSAVERAVGMGMEGTAADAGTNGATEANEAAALEGEEATAAACCFSSFSLSDFTSASF